MRDFVTSIYSPSWWIGVVVVSFAINLASAYAKPALDRFWARYSSTRRAKLTEARVRMEAEVAAVVSKPDGMVLLTLDEVKAVLAAVLCFTLCSVFILSLFFLSGRVRLLIFAGLFVFLLLGLAMMHTATKTSDLLRLAKAKREGLTRRCS